MTEARVGEARRIPANPIAGSRIGMREKERTVRNTTTDIVRSQLRAACPGHENSRDVCQKCVNGERRTRPRWERRKTARESSPGGRRLMSAWAEAKLLRERSAVGRAGTRPARKVDEGGEGVLGAGDSVDTASALSVIIGNSVVILLVGMLVVAGVVLDGVGVEEKRCTKGGLSLRTGIPGPEASHVPRFRTVLSGRAI
ncbi:hypothetical protein FB451DRAFT_1535064 [Mycena latifolia]|nr:hypothetical protein FB451DRAFT_1535064 [Mycena latifolia]